MGKFDKPMARQIGGASSESKIGDQLNLLIQSASKSLATEVRLSASFPGFKGECVGCLEGTPLVRRWNCYAAHFRAETPISSGLACDGLNEIRVTDWKKAVHDLGSPKSVTPNGSRSHMDVIWEEGGNQLKAMLSAEQLVKATVPFEVTHIGFGNYNRVHEMIGDVDFGDIGKLTGIKLGHAEASGGYYVSPASLETIGTAMPEMNRTQAISMLKLGLKELPVYEAEQKLAIARKALKDFPLKELIDQMITVGRAKTVDTKSSETYRQEQNTAHYGDETWATGGTTTMRYNTKFLVCDGVDVHMPGDKSLGETFPSTGEVVARDFLVWASAYMERSLTNLKTDLEKVHLDYFGVPDPEIYKDFNARGSNPIEEELRKSLEEMLNQLNARVEKAQTAALFGMERTDPIKAAEKLPMLAEYRKQYETQKKLVADQKLERFFEKPDSGLEVQRLLGQAERDAKAKNVLAVSSACPLIEQAIKRFDEAVETAKAAREAYFEHKKLLETEADELKKIALAVKADKDFGHLPEALRTEFRNNITQSGIMRTGFKSSEWKADIYKGWIERTKRTLAEIRSALETARTTKPAAQETIPMPVNIKQEPALAQGESVPTYPSPHAREVSSEPVSPIVVPPQASLRSSLADKFNKILGGNTIAPTINTPTHPAVPKQEISEVMTETIRQNFMFDLTIARDILNALKTDLPSYKVSDKLTDKQKNQQKLRETVVERLKILQGVQDEVTSTKDVARARGIVGDMSKRAEKVAQDAARLAGENTNWPERYKKIVEMIPAIETDWEGKLSDEALEKLVPRLMAIAKRSESLTDLKKEISETIAEGF